MEIHIDKLKTTVLQLDHAIEEYEEIYMNFYHVVSSSSFFWNDERSKKFFEMMYIEKNQVKQSVDELKVLRDIYREIITNYEEIGNRIRVQLQEKNSVVKYFDQYLEQVQRCLNICQSVPLDVYPLEASLIVKEKSQLSILYREVEEVKEQFIILFDKIQEIENNINKKISKFQVQKILETEEEY